MHLAIVLSTLDGLEAIRLAASSDSDNLLFILAEVKAFSWEKFTANG